MTKNERLRELYKKYGLSQEDTFRSPQGWTIITRQGIDAIQASAGIDITYDVIVCERDFVVVKAKGSLLSDKEVFVETFGEADRAAKGGNCRQNYPVAMAEKRAMSRAVLKLSGFYALGAYGEDEGDFKRDDKPEVTAAALSKAKDMILRGEKTAEEMLSILEGNYQVPESIKYSYINLKPKN